MSDPRLDYLATLYLTYDGRALPVRWQPTGRAATLRELLRLKAPTEIAHALTDHGLVRGEDVKELQAVVRSEFKLYLR